MQIKLTHAMCYKKKPLKCAVSCHFPCRMIGGEIQRRATPVELGEGGLGEKDDVSKLGRGRQRQRQEARPKEQLGETCKPARDWTEDENAG